LAKPEKKPLTFAVGLLLISSSVSMSIPFTVGKLIDYFTSANPVRFHHVITLPDSLEGNFQQIPYELTLGQASGILFVAFTIGALANTGRAILMRMAGQRIVARLRERTYVAALKQEVEFVERGEGDVLSRLSVDSSVVGERYEEITPSVTAIFQILSA
jgi:ABC-type multidrug transport system fused ATPase/permease subunit